MRGARAEDKAPIRTEIGIRKGVQIGKCIKLWHMWPDPRIGAVMWISEQPMLKISTKLLTLDKCKRAREDGGVGWVGGGMEIGLNVKNWHTVQTSGS
jgi:hypothetical protein